MRMTVKDFEKVDRVMKHESIYPNIKDDFTVPVEDFTVKELLGVPSVYVLMPNDESVFIAHPLNNTTYVYHVNITKQGRGPEGEKAQHQSLEYLFTQTPIQTLISFVPVFFKNVVRASERFGFKEIGVLPKGVTRNGQLEDQHVITATRESWLKSFLHTTH